MTEQRQRTHFRVGCEFSWCKRSQVTVGQGLVDRHIVLAAMQTT